MNKKHGDLDSFRHTINEAYLMNETEAVNKLLENADVSKNEMQSIKNIARDLVEEVRKERKKKSGLDAFLFEYDLSSDEGVALMCLAEAMLRIPDKQTANELIRDKITSADWGSNVGKSDSSFVNASTWALMLTGKVISDPKKSSLGGVLKRMLRTSGEPFVYKAVAQAMKILGKQFVMGRDIKEAVKRAKEFETKGYLYSYDMLGEAARTEQDAEAYFQAYSQAIANLSSKTTDNHPEKSPGISVKLSALHPRYEYAQRKDVIAKVVPRILSLVAQARGAGVGITIDAEEARVLDLSLDIFEKVYSDPGLLGWSGFGLAVQAYQKRAPYLIEWLNQLYQKHGRRIMVRLIKGAYWDSEIKYAQMQGLEGYPVFTRKASTDVSYVACAKQILANQEAFYPQFGTHNAYSVATILSLTKEKDNFEFQALHGMGNALYDSLIENDRINCRIYAPVGGHKALLAYLVRRLLENGANTSFVNRIADENSPIDDLLVDPCEYVAQLKVKEHLHIPLPVNIFGVARENSMGLDLSDRDLMSALKQTIKEASKKPWHAGAIIGGKMLSDKVRKVATPYDKHKIIGAVSQASRDQVEEALKQAHAAVDAWDKVRVKKRAECLFKAADLLEQQMPEFIALSLHEAGKTLPDAVAEIREAVDFCRYYANLAIKTFKKIKLPGYTGEINEFNLAWPRCYCLY